MAQISRLKDPEISNGNVINADDLDSEYNQLVNESNSQDTRITTIESGTFTQSGTLITSNNLQTNGISERTAGSGVTIDGMKAQDGYVNVPSIRATISSIDTTTDVITTDTHGLSTGDAVRVRAVPSGTIPTGLSASNIYYARVLTTTTITLHPTAADATGNTNKVDITNAGAGTRHIIGTPTTLAEGDLWFDNTLKMRRRGATVLIPDSNDISGLITGNMIKYVDANTVQIQAGTSIRDSSGVECIRFTASQNVVLNASGANGLDTGSEGSGYYYLWAIKKSSDGTTAGLFSASSVSPTMPSGYDLKRLLPFCVKNDASNNIVPFFMVGAWTRPYIGYTANTSDMSGPTAGTLTAISAGTSTTYAAVSGNVLIPPISTVGRFMMTGVYASSNQSAYIRPTGSSLLQHSIRATNTNPIPIATFDMETNSSQQFDYKISAAGISLYVDILGFYVTEVS